MSHTPEITFKSLGKQCKIRRSKNSLGKLLNICVNTNCYKTKVTTLN